LKVGTGDNILTSRQSEGQTEEHERCR